MSHKITKLSFWFIAVLFISLCPLVLQAQEPAAPATTAKPMHSETTITGCLWKGDSADRVPNPVMAAPLVGIRTSASP